MDSNPGLRRYPGGGNGNPLQYSCLEKLMVRGTWWTIVHRVANSRTWLSAEAQSSIETGSVQFSSVAQLCPTLWLHGLQHARLACPSPTLGVYSNSYPFSQSCHPTISFSVIPFSSHLQSFPVSGSFPMSQFFPSGGQNIGVSALASVFPMNIQDWSPLGLTGWISLQSKGLSRDFSNATVRRHQVFSAQLSLQSNSHIHTWLLEKS